MSAQAREALVEAFGSAEKSQSLRVGTDLWIVLPGTDTIEAPLILRCGQQLSYEVGPEYRHTSWVLTDGDAADLYYRITYKKHPTLKGELSEEYKAFLEGKGR